MNQPDRSEIEIENLAEKIAFSAREMSAEIDRDRRLPDELVALLREAGLLRAGMPREVQAPELAPGLALEMLRLAVRNPPAQHVDVFYSGDQIQKVSIGALDIPTQEDGSLWVNFSPHDEGRSAGHGYGDCRGKDEGFHG